MSGGRDLYLVFAPVTDNFYRGESDFHSDRISRRNDSRETKSPFHERPVNIPHVALLPRHYCPDRGNIVLGSEHRVIYFPVFWKNSILKAGSDWISANERFSFGRR